MTNLAKISAWSGLVIGPAAWAVSTQLNFALASWACRKGAHPIPVVALVLAIIALMGAFTSARARPAEGSLKFMAAIGALLSVLTAVIILLHGTAALILSACER